MSRKSLVPSNANNKDSDAHKAAFASATMSKQVQFNNNGIIILRALYGDIIEFGEPTPSTLYRPGKCIDISMQLQSAIEPTTSQLILKSDIPVHKRIQDVINPNATIKNKLIRNRLSITYYYGGELHFALFEDTELIILPMENHKVNTIQDNDEYPDLQYVFADVPEWLSLLPSPDDEVFELIGENWDYGYKFQNIPVGFNPHIRPEGSLCEPRFIVYERQKRVEERLAQKRLLLGFSAVTVCALSALQMTGIINMRTWPGINLLFGNTTTTSTTSTTSTTTTPTITNQSQQSNNNTTTPQIQQQSPQ